MTHSKEIIEFMKQFEECTNALVADYQQRIAESVFKASSQPECSLLKSATPPPSSQA
jgi:hypothetical protein